MENNTIKSYNIKDIASWQKDISNDKIQDKKVYPITLPNLQRGFVWKPYQIESLWDSILRGYPIGAILMSLNGELKELLDGQQRCTSIALGFVNPLISSETIEIFNLKKNIPSIWIDLKPLQKSKHGLKFGVRVLTRSHPWGYQLEDHKQTISSSEREKALNYFRNKINNQNCSFSSLPIDKISPWDAYYPIPLSILLEYSNYDFENWKVSIEIFIKKELVDIKTKHTELVNYADLSSSDFKAIYYAIRKSKELLIPEILIKKETIEEDEEIEESSDATLFVRLNSEGTRISGEELIYSLLKATFPESKELVEKIGLKFIAPSKIVNIFSRLTLMQIQKFENFQTEMNLVNFRKQIKNNIFSTTLKGFITSNNGDISVAEHLVNQAVEILSLNPEIPNIYIKETITKNSELFFILIAYLSKNENLTVEEKMMIHKDFHSISIFNTDLKNVSKKIFYNLKEFGFNKWTEAINKIKNEKTELYSSLIKPYEFEDFILNYIVPKYISNRDNHFSDEDFLKSIISSNKEKLDYLFLKNNQSTEYEEDYQNEQLIKALKYWKSIADKIIWNRSLLVLVQRKYFNREFFDYMEFDGIEDTNRPWDWDHIYPNSWVYSNKKISILVKWLVNTNGNFRALSFNENRSQSNHESPEIRFQNNLPVQTDSFINKNDLQHWLNLTNNETRLTELNEEIIEKVNEFVFATFKRMCNIYSDVYNLFNH